MDAMDFMDSGGRSDVARVSAPRTLVLVILLCLLAGVAGAVQDSAHVQTVHNVHIVHPAAPEEDLEWLRLEAAGHSLRVPCLRTSPLHTPNPALKRGIVVIHGSGRNAHIAMANLLLGAKAAGVAERCLVVAPRFIEEPDLKRMGEPADVPFWRGGWREGDLSKSTVAHPRPVRLSCFTVVDLLLEAMDDKELFPNLRDIVVVGHSAGGQFVNRYAAGNRTEPRLEASVRYVVANPSSYVYFDDRRRVEGSTVQFAAPSVSKRIMCPCFDMYKYGLSWLNAYMTETGKERIPRQYAARKVWYLLGSDDNDPQGNGVDRFCPAMWQGVHRLERGMVYYNYLLRYFGCGIAAGHRFRFVPGVAHSSRGIYTSPQGVVAVFDAFPTGLPPTIDCCEELRALEETEATLRLRAADPEDAGISWRALGLWAGATFQDQGDGTAVFAWTPPAGAADASPYCTTFLASDGALSASVTVAITVTPAPRTRS